jgi:hypothetical protein
VSRHRTNVRVILGIIIVLMLAWCYSIGNRVFHLWHEGKDLARGSSRLETVDTALAPGSRVELGGTKVADLHSTGHLGTAAAHPDVDTVALFHRWPALTAFVTRDSARFKKERGGPTPGIDAAARFLTSSAAGDLYLGEFVIGADTARLAHDTTMYATVDASTGPIVIQLHAGPHPAGTMRGELFIGPPTALYRVY